MRATSIIYKRELGAYLRSPLSWVIAALCLLVAGILFQGFAMRGEDFSAVVLEKFFYFSTSIALIAGVALSFRLIAEERQNHAMVLLNTSPVRDSQIVVGKFLAALTFLAIIMILSIYMPLLIKVRGKVTFAQIMVGYLGLYLLGAAVLAIGTFASSLTRNILIALVVAAAITAILVLTHLLAVVTEGTMRDLFNELDLWWIHFQNGFMRGVLNLKDVVYYVAVTYFFLVLAVKTLEAKRWQ
jgi:gliding motility-associated transport system permease protein